MKNNIGLLKMVIIFLFTISSLTITAQHSLPLNDLSAFRNPGKTWQIAEDVSAEYATENFKKVKKGTGVLLNIPTKKEKGSDIYTTEEYGDVDISMNFMMTRNSSSGIFLQGRYQVQLSESWGIQLPTATDNGGIYPRFDESRGVGNEKFEGYAPRVNSSLAPGLWQHIFISFRAPRFDASGRKTENAKILRITLNGVIIHENVELLGPTRGAEPNNEAPKGPIRIQGDHGSVAFKNIRIINYYGEQPQLTNLKYQLYAGKFEFIPDYSEYEPVEEASLEKFGTSFLSRESDFLIRFTANVIIKQPGHYIFQRETNGGGYVKVNNQQVSDLSSYTTTPIKLDAGTYPLEVGYLKPYNWFPNSFGLKISSDNVREFLASDPRSLAREFPDPVIIDPETHPMMRSFIDLPNGKRIVHAISVGSPSQLHFSYDLDNGSLFQAWRGKFLDAGNMWVGRGDGSSRALGTIIHFDSATFPLIKLDAPDQTPRFDTAGSNFLNLGYEAAKNNKTIFKYQAHGVTVNDAIQIANSKWLERTFTIDSPVNNLYLKIAEAKNIEALSDQLFSVGDKSYYIRFDEPKIKPIIKEIDGRFVLLAPVNKTLSYAILF